MRPLLPLPPPPLAGPGLLLLLLVLLVKLLLLLTLSLFDELVAGDQSGLVSMALMKIYLVDFR